MFLPKDAPSVILLRQFVKAVREKIINRLLLRVEMLCKCPSGNIFHKKHPISFFVVVGFPDAITLNYIVQGRAVLHLFFLC